MGDAESLLAQPFVVRMLVAAVLASVACGVIGTLVVVKRVVFLSGGIAHTTFGGIGLAYYLQDKAGWTWLEPTWGAAVVALGAAALLGTRWIRTRVREDSAIGALWVVGMAVGVLLLRAVDRTAVVVQDPMSLLFGNILLVQDRDLWTMGALVVVVVVITAVLFKDFQILTFDEEHARLSGVHVTAMNLLLMALIALTVVALLELVGVVLAIAMLTLPAATAGLFARDLRTMMLGATALSLVCSVAGSLLALPTDWPPGPTIVILLTTLFGAALAARQLVRRRTA